LGDGFLNNIQIFSNFTVLVEAAIDLFIHLAEDSIRKRGRFTVALSGGSTPQPLYAALGSEEHKNRLDWDHIHLFWGDERHVPSTHPDSNYGMVHKALLSKIVIPASNIHRVPTALDVHAAARQYEGVLQSFFDGALPRFDLVLLGMGEDGHTASLFPHSAGLNEEERWFIANYAPKKEVWRLTLTKNVINNARNVLVLVRGAAKAKMLKDVLNGPVDAELKPIQFIDPIAGEMLWMVDREAASQIVSFLCG
jgi:6-phosphogluconolactonase